MVLTSLYRLVIALSAFVWGVKVVIWRSIIRPWISKAVCPHVYSLRNFLSGQDNRFRYGERKDEWRWYYMFEHPYFVAVGGILSVVLMLLLVVFAWQNFIKDNLSQANTGWSVAVLFSIATITMVYLFRRRLVNWFNEKADELEARRAKQISEHLEQLKLVNSTDISSLVCDAGREATIDALPEEKQTFQLKLEAFAAKHCKPFANH